MKLFFPSKLKFSVCRHLGAGAGCEEGVSSSDDSEEVRYSGDLIGEIEGDAWLSLISSRIARITAMVHGHGVFYDRFAEENGVSVYPNSVCINWCN